MREICIQAGKRANRIMATLYIDIPHYEVGIQDNNIHVLVKDDRAISVFIRNFTDWLKVELLVNYGDEYFRNHEHEEKWKCWRMDKRFQKAYSDDLFDAHIRKILEHAFDTEEYWDVVVLSLDEVMNALQELVELRLELINCHFTENLHENYILLRQPPKKQPHTPQPY